MPRLAHALARLLEFVHQHSSEPKFDLDAAKKALEAIEAERLKAEVLKGYSRGTQGVLKGY